MVNCTEAGRSHGGDHLKGLGMLARYFPCRVFLPQPDICTETAASVVSSYWDGFKNDFSFYLSKLRKIEVDTRSLTYQFAYNYDGHVVRAKKATSIKASNSVYPKTGVFDIVVNVCLADDIGDTGYGKPGLIFKIDYVSNLISKEKLEHAFKQ